MMRKLKVDGSLARRVLGLMVCGVALASSASAFDSQYWLRKMSGQKGRRIYNKQTTVAAVRGIDDPGEVDPRARNFEAVKAMSEKNFPPEKVSQFAQEGNLKAPGASKQAAEETPMSQAASRSIDQSPVSRQMKSAVRPITLEEEMDIGVDVAANVAAQFGVVKNDTLTDYVNLVGLDVARFSERKEVTYRFAILDSDILNAFAAPGGYIFITRGLLNSLKNESQLACVLAHEIAHVTQKHVINEIQKARIVDASIPSYIKASAKKATWISQVTDLAIQSLWKGLSREDELGSDNHGIQYAAAAGYDPQSFMEVLETIKTMSQNPSQSKELKFLFSTHPKPEDRIANAQARIKAVDQGGLKLEERFQKQVKS